jgi:ATP-binding cassette, subfamily B, bacterial PglK
MIETINKVLGILDKREKIWIVWLFLAVLIMAIIETAGVASILPFMAVVGSPKIVETNKILRYTYELIGFNNIREYLFFLGSVIFVFLVVSNIFKALTTYFMLRYENHLYYTLSRRLLAKYLVQPYLFFLNMNTADLGSNILAEVRNVIIGLISPGLQVIANLFVSLFLIILLMAVDPLLGIVVVLVLGGAYSLVFYMIRGKLDKIGKGQLEANKFKFKAASEALSGIKDIKILGKESFFLEEFSINADRHAKFNSSA